MDIRLTVTEPISNGIQWGLTCTSALVVDQSQRAQVSRIETEQVALWVHISGNLHLWTDTKVTDIQWKAYFKAC